MANRYWVGGTATWDGTAGTKWASTSGGAGGQSVPTVADAVFFDANSGANTITLGADANCLSLAMTGFTGTLAFSTFKISIAGNAATVYTGAATFAVSGTKLLEFTYSGSTGTRTISTANTVEANALNISVTAGTDTIVIGTGALNIDFTGFNGTFSNGARTIFGNLTVSTGMTLSAGTNVTTFGATSGTKTITTNGKTLDFPVTFGLLAGTSTYQLVDAMTVGSTRTVTLTNNTLNLNNKNLTCGLFSSSNSNTRVLAFGTGQIYVTSTGVVWGTTSSTNLTTTGTPIVNVTNSTATAVTINSGSLNEANSISFNFTAGTYALTFLGSFGFTAKNVNFTGFAGTWNAIGAGTIYGNLILSTGMTLTASANILTFAATSGTKTITTNGKTLDFPLTFNGVGGVFQLQDALTLGAAQTLTMSRGTIQFKPSTTNSAGTFVVAGNSSNQVILGSSTAGSQFTLTQTSGTVSASYATISDSIATGGATWIGLTASGAIDAGNNSGWFFDAPFLSSDYYGVELRSFTERGRY
jgi:hypothetical protein